MRQIVPKPGGKIRDVAKATSESEDGGKSMNSDNRTFSRSTPARGRTEVRDPIVRAFLKDPPEGRANSREKGCWLENKAASRPPVPSLRRSDPIGPSLPGGANGAAESYASSLQECGEGGERQLADSRVAAQVNPVGLVPPALRQAPPTATGLSRTRGRWRRSHSTNPRAPPADQWGSKQFRADQTTGTIEAAAKSEYWVSRVRLGWLMYLQLPGRGGNERQWGLRHPRLKFFWNYSRKKFDRQRC